MSAITPYLDDENRPMFEDLYAELDKPSGNLLCTERAGQILLQLVALSDLRVKDLRRRRLRHEKDSSE